ncbi:MAG TPA: DUF72 domain-containing protein [Chloroflexota bacterium]
MRLSPVRSLVLRIGTSGWNYPHWRERFYPPGLKPSEWLGFYARRFDTVEINYSFYRLPTREAFASWGRVVPEGFVFAVKGSRFITHVKRLRDPAPAVTRFFERAAALGAKLGPALWQLPPQFQRDPARLAAFLQALPEAQRHAFEFRHASWFVDEVYALLRARGAALCIADRDGHHTPLVHTASWTYVRFHSGLAGGSYTEAQLQGWAERLRQWSEAGVQVYAYFNNDWEGYAPANAARLRELVARARDTAPPPA